MGAFAAPPNPPPNPRVHIEAVQTVTPWKSSGPRRPRRIVSSPEALSEAMQSRVCVVLAYGKPVEDSTGWNLAGRLKESLNVALSEHPVIAGRLRHADEAAGGGIEVRFVDSGVRLVQARADGCMDKFLGPAGAVAELAYWEDVEEKSFQYSPLFFVQNARQIMRKGMVIIKPAVATPWQGYDPLIKWLTIFEGQGYSIGLSGSLLVTDPFLLSDFIKTWTNIHSRMQFSDPSIFHLSKFRLPSGTLLRPHPLSAQPHCTHRTLFFSSSSPDPSYPLQQPFTLFFNDPSGDLRVEAREGTPPTGCVAKDLSWVEHVGIDGVGFEVGMKPVSAFCFLQSCVGRGMVVEMPGREGCDGHPMAVATSEVKAGM